MLLLVLQDCHAHCLWSDVRWRDWRHLIHLRDLNLNFSVGSSDYTAGHNLTISSSDEFVLLSSRDSRITRSTLTRSRFLHGIQTLHVREVLGLSRTACSQMRHRFPYSCRLPSRMASISSQSIQRYT